MRGRRVAEFANKLGAMFARLAPEYADFRYGLQAVIYLDWLSFKSTPIFSIAGREVNALSVYQSLLNSYVTLCSLGHCHLPRRRCAQHVKGQNLAGGK